MTNILAKRIFVAYSIWYHLSQISSLIAHANPLGLPWPNYLFFYKLDSLLYNNSIIIQIKFCFCNFKWRRFTTAHSSVFCTSLLNMPIFFFIRKLFLTTSTNSNSRREKYTMEDCSAPYHERILFRNSRLLIKNKNLIFVLKHHCFHTTMG